MKRKIYAILNFLGFIGTVVVNGLANALPINGKTTGELSDNLPNLFVPAGFTFSIWGVIYILLALFAVYQLLRAFKQDEKDGRIIDAVGPYFFIASCANMGWIFAWHYQVILVSLLLMIILLLSLICIYLNLDIRKREMKKTEKFFALIPFSVYLGWITVATVANVTALLVDIGWNGFGIPDQVWTIIVLIVATLITLAVLFSKQGIYDALVIVWAYFGILMKRLNAAGELETGIVVSVSVCLAVIVFDIIFSFVKKKVY
jgi:hypothetical protein